MSDRMTGGRILISPRLAISPTERYRTKTSLAADALRHAIATGVIHRGERLRISQLEQDLGMSATPIREAIQILSAEGLLWMESHRSIRVAEFTEADAEEIYSLRSTFEAMATRKAVPNLSKADVLALETVHAAMCSLVGKQELSQLAELNAEWHHTIYAASGSKYLHFFIQKLWAWFPWDIWVNQERACASMEEHEAILSAIRSRDGELAASLMEDHIIIGAKSVTLSMRSIATGPS
ncbi:MAG: GntR family transcriptional regulator [Nitrospiraceae bacterium]|nr:GntR family transcriptional regulator [Nitrospiraceae bacterium]